MDQESRWYRRFKRLNQNFMKIRITLIGRVAPLLAEPSSSNSNSFTDIHLKSDTMANIMNELKKISLPTVVIALTSCAPCIMDTVESRDYFGTNN